MFIQISELCSCITLSSLMTALPYVTTTEAVTCQSYCYSALDLMEGSGNYNTLGECISLSPAPYPLFTEL